MKQVSYPTYSEAKRWAIQVLNTQTRRTGTPSESVHSSGMELNKPFLVLVYIFIWFSVYSSTGANLDFLLKASPYFMNKNGTGIAMTATPPRIDIAGPTPKLWNMGVATSGKAAARMLRRKVFPDTALAAYSWYVSTKKLIHCWKMILKPAPIKTAASTGAIPVHYFSIVPHRLRLSFIYKGKHTLDARISRPPEPE